MGLKSFIQKAALKAIDKLAPDAEEDSWVDLKREELEGELSREQVKPGGEPTPAEDGNKPVYRRDGQVHNFAAVPFPGSGKRLTKAQYEARYAGARPAPTHNVSKFVDYETTADDFKPSFGDNCQSVCNEIEDDQ